MTQILNYDKTDIARMADRIMQIILMHNLHFSVCVCVCECVRACVICCRGWHVQIIDILKHESV